MNLLDLLTEPEKKMMEDYISYYGYCGDEYAVSDGRRAPLDYILRFWNINKVNLYKALGNNLIISKDIVYNKPKDDIMQDLRTWKENMWGDSDSTVKFFKEFDDLLITLRRDRTIDTYVLAYLTSPRILYDGVWPAYDPIELPNPKRPNSPIKINAGSKIIKALGKIAEAYDLKGFEEFRLKHSQIMNDKSIKGKLCLSIHPMDYMTMSDNGYGWESCMSWTNDGCYKAGTIEMMNSDMVVVAYIQGAEDYYPCGRYNGCGKWNNKKWRELIICNSDMISNVKGYPYINDDLSKIALSWLKELVEKNLGFEYLPKKYVVNDYGDVCEEDFSIEVVTSRMYNDYTVCDHYAFFTPEVIEEKKELYIDYSGEMVCVWCGAEDFDFESEGLLMCNECFHPSYGVCESCGEDIYDEDGAYSVDGSLLCESCYYDYTTLDSFDDEERHFNDNIFDVLIRYQDKLIRSPWTMYRWNHQCYTETYFDKFPFENLEQYFRYNEIANQSDFNFVHHAFIINYEDITPDGWTYYDECGGDLEDFHPA